MPWTLFNFAVKVVDEGYEVNEVANLFSHRTTL